MLARVTRPIPKGAEIIPVSSEPIDVSGWLNVDTLVKQHYLEYITQPVTLEMLQTQKDEWEKIQANLSKVPVEILPAVTIESGPVLELANADPDLNDQSAVEPESIDSEPTEVAPNKNRWSHPNKARRR